MMRSDSDLDESIHWPPTPDNNSGICNSSSNNNEDDELAEQEETEPTGTELTSGDESHHTKKEWRKLWRSQKIYWRERENSQSNIECDERDEVEQDGGSSGSGEKEEEGDGAHEDSLCKNNEHDHQETTKQKMEDNSGAVKNESPGIQSPKHGWKLLKRIQQRRAARAKEEEQHQTTGTRSCNNEDGGENDQNNGEDESALWRDILFTIGSLTDDENGVTTDDDLDKSLDDIEEEILRQAGLENNSSGENANGDGVIPPSPWSSLKRLRNKIKENSAISATGEEKVDFVEDDEEEAPSDEEKDKVLVDESRDEVAEAPSRAWASLKRFRGRTTRESANTDKEEHNAEDDDVVYENTDDNSDDDDDTDDNGEEAVEGPSPWSSLKRFRDRIKENTDPEGESEKPTVNKDENGKEQAFEVEEDDIVIENGEEIDETGEASTTRRWGVLNRLRKKLDADSNDSIEHQIESLAKELEQAFVVSNTTEASDDNLKPSAEEETEEDQETNDGEKDEGDETNTSRWGVLNRLRKKLDADSNDSIEVQIESLAKELEKEQQTSSVSNTNEAVDANPSAKEGTEETDEDQETNNNGQRTGWALFKRVQDRLTAERTVDDETYGYDNIDEAFAFRTFHVLHARNQELEDLVERLQRANEILKAECKLNTVKVTELTNMIETKEGNVTEDALLHKSIENAELVMQVDELQVELDKATSSVESLKAENREHKRLINGMGRVLDALHSAHVGESSVGASSMGPSGELSIENLEPKIERIMEDREQLVLRCNQLERENELKDEQIEQLSEALDAQSFQHSSVVEKLKDDDQSIRSELTRSTYTGTSSVSSSSIESDDNVNSRFRNLYNSVSSKMMSANMESVQEDDSPYFDTELCAAGDDDTSSVNAIQGHNDELESIKKRLNKADPKYVEFLSLMDQKGMMALESVPSGEAEERPSERPEQEITSSDEIICELVI